MMSSFAMTTMCHTKIAHFEVHWLVLVVMDGPQIRELVAHVKRLGLGLLRR